MILSFEKHISEGEKNGFFSQIKKVSYIVLISVFIAVQLTLSNATNDAQRLKDKQHTLSYWNKTKNIYTINFQGYDSSVAEDSLEARNINDELKNFYQNKVNNLIQYFLFNELGMPSVNFTESKIISCFIVEFLHFLDDRISSYDDIDLKPLVVLSLVFHAKKYQILKDHFQY